MENTTTSADFVREHFQLTPEQAAFETTISPSFNPAQLSTWGQAKHLATQILTESESAENL